MIPLSFLLVATHSIQKRRPRHSMYIRLYLFLHFPEFRTISDTNFIVPQISACFRKFHTVLVRIRIRRSVRRGRTRLKVFVLVLAVVFRAQELPIGLVLLVSLGDLDIAQEPQVVKLAMIRAIPAGSPTAASASRTTPAARTRARTSTCSRNGTRCRRRNDRLRDLIMGRNSSPD
jgi:hypothetical protein